ncbi:unnamed protein product [Rotaria sordida]|uniref:Uncharacterized protein n=1 Tax=Rotaria sordida TaxID=392033 RepID=A0A813XXC9_9BILA|nr:unnamed protein product [Rotaria sordida]CAF0877108.1 unnamed protein product [Rotaria sordida]CAF3624883.1 unnamed protein product [Rotaria sordida]CAF4119827.1 unnamed protein product [Rotaria sordida]
MKKMRGKKKKQQRQRKCRANETIKRTSSNKINNSNRSSCIVTKNFEIFVTDFLTDPCGLPVELRDCVLVDGTTSLNDTSDNCSSNNCQVLKKIFGNNESIDRMVKNSVPLIVDEPSEKANKSEQDEYLTRI